MEPIDTRLSSYYPHQHHQNANPPTTAATTVAGTASPTNGLLPSSEATLLGYPHSVPAAVTASAETERRKRGRPRKYATPEEALAARKTALAAGASLSSVKSSSKKKAQSLTACAASSSLKKSQYLPLGNAGHGFSGFTPHVISVSAGEDVAQKIMMFMQQSMREICILSASGSISNASLRQPATSGGITYEGRFEIVSLCGSYVRTETGGRTGGLSICLCGADGQILGGGVGGPLQAAGPVQVIVGTFVGDKRKDVSAGVVVSGDAHQLAPIGGGGGGSSGRRIPDEDQGLGFMNQQQARNIHSTPRQSDWTGSNVDFSGGGQESSENGDYY